MGANGEQVKYHRCQINLRLLQEIANQNQLSQSEISDQILFTSQRFEALILIIQKQSDQAQTSFVAYVR